MEGGVRCVKERETLRNKQGWDDHPNCTTHSNSQNKLIGKDLADYKVAEAISPRQNIVAIF